MLTEQNVLRKKTFVGVIQDANVTLTCEQQEGKRAERITVSAHSPSGKTVYIDYNRSNMNISASGLDDGDLQEDLIAELLAEVKSLASASEEREE